LFIINTKEETSFQRVNKSRPRQLSGENLEGDGEGRREFQKGSEDREENELLIQKLSGKRNLQELVARVEVGTNNNTIKWVT